MNEQSIKALGTKLMEAVVASGCIRTPEQDAALAIRVMREELKALIDPHSGRYAEERQLARQGAAGLAMASLSLTCVERILAERTP